MLTGSQGEATCKSQVQFIVTGDAEESDIRSLPRMTFHRGGIDSFVMTTRRSLGNLQYLRIWHDNTGESTLDICNGGSYYGIIPRYRGLRLLVPGSRHLPRCSDRQKISVCQ